MRKVFLLFGLTVSYCFSGDTFVNFYGKNTESTQEHKKIENISGYKELEATLKKFSNAGDAKSTVALATLYEQSFNFGDGTKIAADPIMAKKYYALASPKSSIASFKLGIFEINDRLYESAYKNFKRGAELKNDSSYVASAVAMSTLVLDKFPNDTKKLLQSISTLKPIADSTRLPTTFFALAHSYNALGQEDAANKYLTKACLANKKPKEIEYFCYQGGAEILDKNGRKVNGAQENSSACSN